MHIFYDTFLLWIFALSYVYPLWSDIKMMYGDICTGVEYSILPLKAKGPSVGYLPNDMCPLL